jgi:tryptophan synthase beta subunit
MSAAVSDVVRRAPTRSKDVIVIVNLSGRGDKALAQVAPKVGLQLPV